MAGQAVELPNVGKSRAPATLDEIVPAVELERGIDLLAAAVSAKRAYDWNAVEVEGTVQQVFEKIASDEAA